MDVGRVYGLLGRVWVDVDPIRIIENWRIEEAEGAEEEESRGESSRWAGFSWFGLEEWNERNKRK